MSTALFTIHESGSRQVDLQVTRYSGGKLISPCYQLTAVQEDGSYGYVQLNQQDLLNLMHLVTGPKNRRVELLKWVRTSSEPPKKEVYAEGTFVQYGLDIDDGGTISTAIIEMDDGTVVNASLNLMRFKIGEANDNQSKS